MYNKIYYNSLNRSKLTPPDYVFRIVWPILYILMFLAAFMIQRNSKCVGFCTPLVYFTIQLLINLSWTTVFFGLQMKRLAFMMILAIIGFTLITYSEFIQIEPTAAYLLIPYIAWLGFASYLNYYIIRNNP